MMTIGDLYIDPADELIMIYIGEDPEQRNHYGFFCNGCHSDENNLCYYSDYDLKYLKRIDERGDLGDVVE
jgi:hypothetical protein